VCRLLAPTEWQGRQNVNFAYYLGLKSPGRQNGDAFSASNSFLHKGAKFVQAINRCQRH